MTDQPTIAGALSEAEQALWHCAERGEPDAARTAADARMRVDAKSEADEARAQLLVALALQNAGKHLEAFEAAKPALAAPSPYDVWARSERTYAARAQAQISIADNERVTITDAETLAKSDDPWSRFAAARAYLALGLDATQDNQLAEAGGLLETAFKLMRSTGSDSGVAVASLELGKLKAWQGRGEESLLNLLSGLAVWRGLNEQRSVGIWHEIGSTLQDSRNYVEAVSILEATFKANKSTRTQSALTRALIGMGSLDDAEKQARQVVASEEAAERDAQARNVKHDAYRRIMALRDLGEIALLKRARALEQGKPDQGDDLLEIADARFNEAVTLHGTTRSPNDSLFTRWTGALDKATRTGAPPNVDFGQLRLVQLELLLDAVKRPAEAARNLAKLADVFGQRKERIQELETREQSADAFGRAEDFPHAAQQLELAMRVAELHGAVAMARNLRKQLSLVTTRMRGEASTSEFLVRGVHRNFAFGKIIAATEIESGRRVRIHRYEIPGAMAAKAGAGLKALGAMFADSRVLPGLPTLIRAPPSPDTDGKAPTAFELIVEATEGEPLSEAIAASKGDWQRAVRVIRDLSFTVGLFHQAGMTDCRPDPKEVLVDLGDNPIWLDILPIHANGAHAPIEDVRTLARLLVQWITGEEPKARALAFKSGQMRRIFDLSKTKIPLELDELLSAILLNHKIDAAASPRDLADKLQAFC